MLSQSTHGDLKALFPTLNDVGHRYDAALSLQLLTERSRGEKNMQTYQHQQVIKPCAGKRSLWWPYIAFMPTDPVPLHLSSLNLAEVHQVLNGTVIMPVSNYAPDKHYKLTHQLLVPRASKRVWKRSDNQFLH